jgi:aminopeptidase N
MSAMPTLPRPLRAWRPGRATVLGGVVAAVLAAVPVAVLPVPAAPAPAGFVPGSPGVGDRLLPAAGNGGYDVGHYDLTLAYDPATRHLDGRAAITATATVGLSRFDLDLRGFDVAGVSVDGRIARWRRDGQELVVTPAAGLPAGHVFTTVVRYAGTPEVITDPDGSVEGWVSTVDGAFVVGQPQGSPGWYPANDTPGDKATFDFRVTVPAGTTVVANGVLAGAATAAGRTTFTWRERDPMAPYLATATLGRFDLTRSRLADGTPVYLAVDPAVPDTGVLARVPAMLDFYAAAFGPYPFSAAGAVVDDAPGVGYSLEAQTHPVFDRMPDEETLAHELAHTWFGDSVTPTRWPDIWLSEGFATWAQWLWSERAGGPSAHTRFATLYRVPAGDAFWGLPPADPGTAAHLFDDAVYDRGAMTLQALREKVGEQTFRAILRAWVSSHRHGGADTAAFVALAERVSGRDLGTFFDVWLYRPARPVDW